MDQKKASFSAFQELDIRVGTITEIVPFENAKRPAYKLWVDFGDEVGVLKSSAQITELYHPADLKHKQVLGLVNIPPRQIADFMSECLILGVYSAQGVVLLSIERPCKNGDKLG